MFTFDIPTDFHLDSIAITNGFRIVNHACEETRAASKLVHITAYNARAYGKRKSAHSQI